jgi:putative phosphoribosyl transferase
MKQPDSVKRAIFQDRTQAGKLLADRLYRYSRQSDVIVCALPRGGVPVAAEIAAALQNPLTIFIVRRLSVPGYVDLGIGSVTSSRTSIVDQSVTEALGIPISAIEAMAQQEMRDIERRERLYLRGRPAPDFKDKAVILVADGMTTGSTMLLAVEAIKQLGARRITVAVPVASRDAIDKVQTVADDIVCLWQPETLNSVGEWYDDFTELDDEQVCKILDRAFEIHPTIANSLVTAACNDGHYKDNWYFYRWGRLSRIKCCHSRCGEIRDSEAWLARDRN